MDIGFSHYQKYHNPARLLMIIAWALLQKRNNIASYVLTHEVRIATRMLYWLHDAPMTPTIIPYSLKGT